MRIADGSARVPVADQVDWDSQERLSDIVSAVPLLVFAIDLDGIIRVVTGGSLAQIGIEPEQLVGGNVFELYADRVALCADIRRALAGEHFTTVTESAGRTLEITFTPGHGPDGALAGTLGVSIDITERVRVQQSLQHLAETDSVTGLSSRRFAEAALDRALADDAPLSLLLIDLDDFKDVNDTHGHALGDQVLQRMGERLQAAVPDALLIGRMGGDELVITVGDGDGEAVSRIADDLLSAIARPLVVPAGTTPGEVDVSITASMGIAVAPRDGTTATALLARADTAMYTAKRSGGAAYRFYDRRTDGARRRLTVATKLRRAVARREIHPAFQPLRVLSSRRIIGFEALARWNDPELGQVSPAEFITLAEKSPLIDDLFDTMLDQAMAAAVDWGANSLQRRFLGINLATRQLRDRSLAARIAATAATHGFPLDRLYIELTETAMMDDDDKAYRTLLSISDAGISVYIDDFGVGYSNISRLTDLSAAGILDGVKIDRRFVADPGSPRAASLLRLFRRMGEAFGVDTVLEGIETEEQLQVAADLGFRLGQGWHIGRPMSAEAALHLLEQQPVADPAPRAN